MAWNYEQSVRMHVLCWCLLVAIYFSLFSSIFLPFAHVLDIINVFLFRFYLHASFTYSLVFLFLENWFRCCYCYFGTNERTNPLHCSMCIHTNLHFSLCCCFLCCCIRAVDGKHAETLCNIIMKLCI